MVKNFIKVLLVLSVFATAASPLGADEGKKAEEPKKYSATLSGKEVVPAVNTEAKGTAIFTMNEELDGINYSIDVSNLKNVTGAHIHKGKRGLNGPVVLALIEGKAEGEVEGNLVEGVILEMDLEGPLQGKSLDDLIKLFRNKEAYVQIHTEEHPKGELRGVIK